VNQSPEKKVFEIELQDTRQDISNEEEINQTTESELMVYTSQKLVGLLAPPGLLAFFKRR
jgi:hypothetical protein